MSGVLGPYGRGSWAARCESTRDCETTRATPAPAPEARPVAREPCFLIAILSCTLGCIVYVHLLRPGSRVTAVHEVSVRLQIVYDVHGAGMAIGVCRAMRCIMRYDHWKRRLEI